MQTDASISRRPSGVRAAVLILAGIAIGVLAITITGAGADPNKLTNWQALVLGVTQGITEFLPISSSGHLILVPWLFNWHYLENHSDFNKTFDVSLHLGTLIAVLAYFRLEAIALAGAWFRSIKKRAIETGDERLAWFVVVATIPAAVFGALGESFVEDKLGQPYQIAIFMAVFAIVLWVADKTPVTRKMEEFDLRTAIGVGVAQALALAPGVSRSGITISAGRFLGLSRDDAARFSFFLYAPVVGGAVVYKSVKDLHGGFPPGTTGPFIVGTLTSMVVGLIAIWALLSYLRNNNYNLFVIYRLVLAAAVLILIATGAQSAHF
ncbi:MAG: undecaprenyl-diphosphatase UppP [Gaiellales bacterium]